MPGTAAEVQKAYNEWVHQYDTNENPTRDLNAQVLRQQAFDVIVANLVLEQVQELAHVFAEAHRVLRPGGLLYIGELHPYKRLQGSQARYRNTQTGKEVLVRAFRPSMSEYINAGIEAGCTLRRIGEWQNEADANLRLLTLLFECT